MSEVGVWVIAIVAALIVVGGVMAWAFGRKASEPSSTAFGDAKFASADTVRDLNLLGSRGIPLGYGVDLGTTNRKTSIAGTPLAYAGDRHVLLIAPTRSGKGTTALVPTLLTHDASALIVDPKGQNAAITARRRRDLGHEVVLLNPFKLHRAHFEARGIKVASQFNPLAGLDPKDDNFVADVTALTEALIVISDSRDAHWGDSARDLISAILMYLLTTPDETPTLPRMREILTQPFGASGEEGKAAPRPPPVGTLLFDLEEMSNSSFAPVAQRARRFLTASREVQSILSTAITQTNFLDDPALAESLAGDELRFIDLKRKKLSIYLILPARYLTVYARWLRLLVVSALNALLSDHTKVTPPVLLMLDEFAALGHLSAIETAMALAAGYSVQLYAALQDINQLKELYKARWETFLANAGVWQIFTPNDMTTAEYVSKRCGTYTGRSVQNTFPGATMGPHGTTQAGRSTSYSETSVPLMPTYELYGLPANRALIFHAGESDPIIAERREYHANDAFKGLYDPDPYHT